jgi:hypothetical protein
MPPTSTFLDSLLSSDFALSPVSGRESQIGGQLSHNDASVDNYIGVHVAHWITTGLMRQGKLVQAPQHSPQTSKDVLLSVPAEEIVNLIAQQIGQAGGGIHVSAVGVGIPGVVRHGLIEESPNLPQLDGFRSLLIYPMLSGMPLDRILQCLCLMTPMQSLRESPRKRKSLTISSAFGLSVGRSDSADTQPLTVFGRAATWWSPWIPKKTTVDVEAQDI